ncbi:hypothetical protein DRW03_20165 [Corallococcus sp. H22C18031201]|nr:hypothetical protein DRW03_20165 [Corallococcus sp. H22C18031201]
MRTWHVVVITAGLLCACAEKHPTPPATADAGTESPSGLERPATRLERPPTGPGLPADLKPPAP